MPASEQYPSKTSGLGRGGSAPARGPVVPMVMAWLGLAALMLLPAAAWQLAGLPGLLLGLPLATAMGWRLCRFAQHRRAPARSPSQGQKAPTVSEPAPPVEAVRLARQIVPVWQRNIEAARGHSERSMSQLLESFAVVAGHLDRALADATGGLQLEMGAADQLIERHRGEIDQLMGLTNTALRLRAEVLDALNGAAAELVDMADLTREVQNIGRATHLLALNTSVEANRSGGTGGGFMVVAHEIRSLAGQSRDAGSRLARHVATLQGQLAELERRNERENIDDAEEVDLRAQQAARAVVLGLLQTLGQVTRASRELRMAGQQVQSDLEKIMVSLQSQDRLSQMLGSVTDDMARYSAWLQGAVDPQAATPTLWLERLEASYTMEELRSSHHGTAAVEQSSTVEFF